MTNTLEFSVVAHEELAAPHGAIFTITGTVKANAKHRIRYAIFGHSTGNVRMVMQS